MSREILERAYRVPIAGVDAMRLHRTLDERILVRYPALARRLFGLWGRLPTTSGLRRRMLLRLASQAASASNRRDFDVLLLGFDRDLDYQIVSAGPGGHVNPDLVGHHRGHAGYLHVWRTMLEGFGDVTLHPEELFDLGDRVLAVTRVRGHGSGSGVPIAQLLFQVFLFRRGLVIRQQDFGDRESALEAAGLRAPASSASLVSRPRS